MADRQHKHRDLWIGLAVGLIPGGLGLSLAIWAAENSQAHVGFWPHAGEVAGLVLVVLGVFLAVAVVRGWWLPGGFREGAGEPAAGTRQTGPAVATETDSGSLGILRKLITEGSAMQVTLGPAQNWNVLLRPSDEFWAGLNAWSARAKEALRPWRGCYEQFQSRPPQHVGRVAQGHMAYAYDLIEQGIKVLQTVIDRETGDG